SMNALVHVVNFAGIAAQQVVAQVQAVLHHLKLDLVDRLCQLQRLGGGGLGSVFAPHGDKGHEKQHHDHGQDESKCHVEFPANRHVAKVVHIDSMSREGKLIFRLKLEL